MLNNSLTVLYNVLIMLAEMSIGLILCLCKKGVAAHAKTLSALLAYVLSPCMVISSFLKIEFSWDVVKDFAIFFAVVFVLMAVFLLILFLIFRKKYDDPKYRIFTVASVFGNVGFFGLPVITGIFPDQPMAAIYSMMYTTAMNLLVFSIGVFFITNDRKYISFKSMILNPMVIGLCIALPLFFCSDYFTLPSLVTDTVSLLGKMVTPVCMISLGMRLSAAKFKDLFTRPMVHLSCLMKLIVFPLFCYLCVVFVPWFSDVFKVSVLVLSGAPSAAIVYSLSEIHEAGQDLSANAVLLATILSVVTVPLLLLVTLI